jgi:hypothetical protein
MVFLILIVTGELTGEKLRKAPAFDQENAGASSVSPPLTHRLLLIG